MWQRLNTKISDLIGKVLWRFLKERQTAALAAVAQQQRQWLTEQGFVGAVDVGLRSGGAIVVISRIKGDRDFVKIIPLNREPMTVQQWKDMITSMEAMYAVKTEYVDTPPQFHSEFRSLRGRGI